MLHQTHAAVRGGNLGSPVVRAVVDHDDLEAAHSRRCERQADGFKAVDDRANAVLLVERGNYDRQRDWLPG